MAQGPSSGAATERLGGHAGAAACMRGQSAGTEGSGPQAGALQDRACSSGAVAPVWGGRCQPTGTLQITERQAAVRTMETSMNESQEMGQEGGGGRLCRPGKSSKLL